MVSPQTCPICSTQLAHDAATDSPLFPFCSTRCKQIDLHRWTEGRYTIVETATLEQMLEEQSRAELDGFQTDE